MKHTTHILKDRIALGAYILLFISISVYAYLLSLTFAHTVETRAASLALAEVKSEVGQLERDYVSVVERLSLDAAKGDGYVTITDPNHMNAPSTVALTVR